MSAAATTTSSFEDSLKWVNADSIQTAFQKYNLFLSTSLIELTIKVAKRAFLENRGFPLEQISLNSHHDRYLKLGISSFSRLKIFFFGDKTKQQIRIYFCPKSANHQATISGRLKRKSECFQLILDNEKQRVSLGMGAKIDPIYASFMGLSVTQQQIKYGQLRNEIDRLKKFIGDKLFCQLHDSLEYTGRMGTKITMFMEHYRCDLSQYDTNQLRQEEIFRVARDILKALRKLGKKGLVHRDITPENIFLTYEGKAVLGDFGDLVEDKTNVWQTNRKSFYASLEDFLFLGQLKEASPAFDMWSFGVLLAQISNREAPITSILWEFEYFLSKTEIFFENIKTSLSKRKPTIEKIAKDFTLSAELKKSFEDLSAAKIYISSLKPKIFQDLFDSNFNDMMVQCLSRIQTWTDVLKQYVNKRVKVAEDDVEMFKFLDELILCFRDIKGCIHSQLRTIDEFLAQINHISRPVTKETVIDILMEQIFVRDQKKRISAKQALCLLEGILKGQNASSFATIPTSLITAPFFWLTPFKIQRKLKSYYLFISQKVAENLLVQATKSYQENYAQSISQMKLDTHDLFIQQGVMHFTKLKMHVASDLERSRVIIYFYPKKDEDSSKVEGSFKEKTECLQISLNNKAQKIEVEWVARIRPIYENIIGRSQKSQNLEYKLLLSEIKIQKKFSGKREFCQLYHHFDYQGKSLGHPMRKIVMFMKNYVKDLNGYFQDSKLCEDYSFPLRILEALVKLHSMKYVHMDLKPANIFLNRNDEPVLGDFGSADKEKQPFRMGGKIFYYSAPEFYFQDGKITVSSAKDMWSFGIILSELAGKIPTTSHLAIFISKIKSSGRWFKKSEKELKKKDPANAPKGNHTLLRSFEHLETLLKDIDKEIQMMSEKEVVTLDDFLDQKCAIRIKELCALFSNQMNAFLKLYAEKKSVLDPLEFSQIAKKAEIRIERLKKFATAFYEKLFSGLKLVPMTNDRIEVEQKSKIDQLLEGLLVYDPSKRLTAQQALEILKK